MPGTSERGGLSPLDRAGAWLATGPLGRIVAFLGDLGAALGGWALRRAGIRRPRD